jgi:hypothetical protein
MQVKNFKINLYVAHKTINNPQNFVNAIYNSLYPTTQQVLNRNVENTRKSPAYQPI